MRWDRAARSRGAGLAEDLAGRVEQDRRASRAGGAASSAAAIGSGRMTMPAPPPYGASSTLRCRPSPHSRRSWVRIVTRPRSWIRPGMLAASGAATIAGNSVRTSISRSWVRTSGGVASRPGRPARRLGAGLRGPGAAGAPSGAGRTAAAPSADRRPSAASAASGRAPRRRRRSRPAAARRSGRTPGPPGTSNSPYGPPSTRKTSAPPER